MKPQTDATRIATNIFEKGNKIWKAQIGKHKFNIQNYGSFGHKITLLLSLSSSVIMLCLYVYKFKNGHRLILELLFTTHQHHHQETFFGLKLKVWTK